MLLGFSRLIPGRSWSMARLAIVAALVCVALGAGASSASARPAALPAAPAAWASYTNPVYGYSLAYPPSMHSWVSDERMAHYITSYVQPAFAKGASDAAPGRVTPDSADVYIEISPREKPTSQSLDAWAAQTVEDLFPSSPTRGARWVAPVVAHATTASGLPALVLSYGASAEEPAYTDAFVDAGQFVYIVRAMRGARADAQLGRIVAGSLRQAQAPDRARIASAKETTSPKRPRPAAGDAATAGQPHLASPMLSGMTLDLPMDIDYARTSMPSIAIDGGGVNTWFDHNRPDYSQNGTLTRYDGAVLGTASPSNCNLSVSCYDGHNGIDFSTNGQTGKNVFASYPGTVSTLWSSCGNELRITVDSSTTLQYCHLANYVVTGGSVGYGQLVAHSGNTGNVGPHLHFSVYASNVSGWPAIDPFGWSSGTDPWGYDRGYMWSGSYPSFIGGAVGFYNPGLSSGWSSFTDPAEGRTAYWAWAGSGAYAWWNLPTLNRSCYGAEVWVPGNNATDTSTRYVVYYADGTPARTAYVDQNANTTWVTIDPGIGRISSVYVYTDSGSGQIGAARVMSACYAGIF